MQIITEQRPWGNFSRLTLNEKTTVKIIRVKAGQSISLQYHNQRAEFWKILEGTPRLTIGEKIFEAKAGDEFFIEKKQKHRLEAVGVDASWLEIAFGDFAEADEVRLADQYNRL